MNLPINRAAEIGIIGACLDGGLESTLEAMESVPSKSFYHDDCRFVFECIQSSAKTGQPADTIGILNQWRSVYGELAFPTDIYDAQDRNPKWTLKDRISTVLDLHLRRQHMIAAHQLLSGASELHKPLQDTVSEFESILGQADANTPPILEGQKLARNVNDDLERRSQLNGALSGIDTGLHGLNRITDGLQMGEVWVIGARPSVGKTALALNVADHVAISGKIPSLFVSLEMSAIALGRRLLSMRSQISGNSIRRGTFTPQEFKSLAVFHGRLKESPIYILDSPGGIRITQLCHSIRAAIKRWGIKVVFIDYIQKIRPDSKGEKRTYEIGDTSSQLVELVKRENINLFALAQLNRESEKDKGRPPRLSDLADSKSIEADADFVGLLDRPINGDESKATLRVAKQRDGERGIIPLEFEGQFCRFKMQQQ